MESKYATLDLSLDTLIKEQEVIAGDWNGESEHFVSGGDVYNEDDAQLAAETVSVAKDLQRLLVELAHQ